MMSFEEFWDNLDEYNGKQFKLFVRENIIQVTAAIIKEILAADELEIGFGWKGKKQFAIISVEPSNMDKDLSLRYHSDGSFDLHFSFYNANANLQSVSQRLEKDQILIPSGLAVLMKECLESKTPKTIRKNELEKRIGIL